MQILYDAAKSLISSIPLRFAKSLNKSSILACAELYASIMYLSSAAILFSNIAACSAASAIAFGIDLPAATDAEMLYKESLKFSKSSFLCLSHL